MIAVFPCPITGCTWTHPGPINAAAPGWLTSEQVISAHLDLHSPAQWLEEIARREAAAAAFGARIPGRADVYGTTSGGCDG